VTLFCCSFAGSRAEESIDGIRVLRQGSRNLFNFTVPARYRSQFRLEGYDVVVDDINKIPFYTPWYVNEPLVGIVHHFFGRTIFLETSFPGAAYVAMSEKLAGRVYRTTPIAAVSESTRQELIELGFPAENVRIVPNCVDQAVYRPAAEPKSPGPVVGHLGRLKKYKGVDHLLHAFRIVRGEFPQARLVIVGDGDFRPELERLARQLEMADVVQFKGYLTKEEAVQEMHTMAVAVNCSAKEGWGLTVIEANACGVPVVASEVPGLRDAVLDEQTGLLYEYGNVEQLAQKILLILRDEHLRNRLREEAIAWARSFNWDDSADKMIELLERTIERKNTSGA
jgi:glycosyltransferase involved in cell wall biosynthesis